MSVGAAETLDGAKILAALQLESHRRVARLDVVDSIASTNTALMQRPAPDIGHSEVLLAELQTAGRGRRGRSWLAAPGSSICLSLSWVFARIPPQLGALSLAMGVCVLRALSATGVQGACLKWPNDILLRNGKLGGILIESRTEPSGAACVVIGIGLNTALEHELLNRIVESGVQPIALSSCGYASVSRNTLAAALIEASITGLSQFESGSLLPFMDEWRDADALQGQFVLVQLADDSAQGIARGVDLTGGLLVETPQGLKKFVSGDVTVRVAP
jgi:BirA family transcriptional regulator, biotin operon repressor / biotin---[acetyl-CoA-carboxylase] ligase